MKNFLIIFIIYSISIPSYGIEYIQKWESYKIPENFSFKKEITEKRKCTKVEMQKKLFKYKNKIKSVKNLKKDKKVQIQTCYVPEEFSDKELGIVNWEGYRVEKGFILSLKLQERGCKNLFTKQIPQFHKYNNDIPPDVNIFQPGRIIKLQDCREKKAKVKIVEKIVEVEKKEKIEEVHKYTRMTNFSIGYHQDNGEDLLGFALDFKINEYDFFVGTSEESLVTQFKYNYFANEHFSIFTSASFRFALENQEGFQNLFLGVGAGYTFDKNKISISQALFAEGNNISFKLEHQFNKDYGLFFDYTQWSTIKKEYKGDLIFSGFNIFF